MDAPRTLPLTSASHPKAEVQSVDPANGILTFAWLDADGNRVDSGGSVARFAPQVGAVQPDGSVTYDEVADSVLIAAIENPAPEPAPVVVLSPLTIRSRLTLSEKIALDTSTDPLVIVVRNDLIAAGEVRSDDPRTALGKQILIDKGIITAERAAEVYA